MGGVNGMPLNSLLVVILITYCEYQDLGYHTVSGMLIDVLSYVDVPTMYRYSALSHIICLLIY
jgi:hypothetical protein